MRSSSNTLALVPARPAAPSARFACEREEDGAAVDALVDRAFGPGRFAKTAERLREGGARQRRELCMCVWLEARLAGAVRLWSARIGSRPVLFLGPIAVDAPFRQHGFGAELVEQACARAAAAGETVVVLVGDHRFFGPLGFETPPAGALRLPGPVDPRRLLWRGLALGSLEGLAGVLAS